jgi:hypothetical protein
MAPSLMHAYRGSDGLPGVLLNGTGHPKQGYEPIIQKLRDHALAPVYLAQSQVEKALYHGVPLLGGQLLSQYRGVGKSTAQHRHMLALASKGRPGGEELPGARRRRLHQRDVGGRAWEWVWVFLGWSCQRPRQTRCRLLGGTRRCADAFLHRGYKAVAPAMHRLDTALVTPAIAHSPAGLHHPMIQGGVADNAVGPDMLQEFLLADNTIAVLDEIEQEIKDLWFERA